MVCLIPQVQWLVYRLSFRETTSQWLIIDNNTVRDLTINGLELGTSAVNVPPTPPIMDHMDHIATKIDNTGKEGWSHRGSVISAT